MKKELYEGGENVRYDVDARGVCTITLDRRDNGGNALTQDMLHEISTRFHKAKEDPAVKVIVLRSAKEKIFCVGVDLREMAAAMSNTDRRVQIKQNREQSKALSDAFAIITDCKKPVIGVANGKSSGAGTTLLRMCDWVVADQERASFAYPEVNFGMLPSISAFYVLPHLLVQKDGLGKARTCFYEGQQMKALTGKDYGIFDEIVPPADLEAAAAGAVEKALSGTIKRWDVKKIDKNKVPEYFVPQRNYVEDPIAEKRRDAVEYTLHKAVQQIMGTSGKTWDQFRESCVEELTRVRCKPETLSALWGYIAGLERRKITLDTVIGGKDVAAHNDNVDKQSGGHGAGR